MYKPLFALMTALPFAFIQSALRLVPAIVIQLFVYFISVVQFLAKWFQRGLGAVIFVKARSSRTSLHLSWSNRLECVHSRKEMKSRKSIEWDCVQTFDYIFVVLRVETEHLKLPTEQMLRLLKHLWICLWIASYTNA